MLGLIMFHRNFGTWGGGAEQRGGDGSLRSLGGIDEILIWEY